MKTYKLALIVALIIMGIGFILFQVIPEFFLRMFNADDSMMSIGVPALRRISICFLPAAFGIITATLFQGTGHGIYSLFASLIRQLFWHFTFSIFAISFLWCICILVFISTCRNTRIIVFSNHANTLV